MKIVKAQCKVCGKDTFGQRAKKYCVPCGTIKKMESMRRARKAENKKNLASYDQRLRFA